MKMNKKNLRYAILKILEDEKNPFAILKSDEIGHDTILKEANFLSREGYIQGNQYASNTIILWGEITEKGEEYLVKNSKLVKSYEFAKEIRDWIPFLY